MEGRELLDTEPNGGKDVEIAESREHLNATSSDSKTGEGGPRAVVHEPGSHYIDEYWLQEAYSRTRKDGATGVDGTTAQQYAERLGDNLRSLLGRFKSGQYQAPPVKRVHIPKGSGSQTRPIGMPTFEDKVLQRAVAMVLEAIYK